MSAGLLERLARGPVLGDGGYLLELEKRGYVQAGPFTPEVSITAPGALAELHREFLHAGAEILQALTFYASEEKLATVGLAGRADDINREAVRVARSVAAEGDALVAGVLSLTWAYDPRDRASADRVRDLFDRQLGIQMGEGIDLVVGETFSYLGEALIAVERAKTTGLPVVVTMAFEDRDPHAYEGDSIGDCARRLVDAGADVVGVNCLRDPERTLPLVRAMRDAVPGAHLATQPAAYRVSDARPDFTASPEFPFALEHLALSRGEMADYAVRARDLGVGLIGSCCGSVANHVRAMAKALGKLSSDERAWKSPTGKAMSAYEHHGHTEAEIARPR
jgi:betaine-homocysteine S-methyltransferase